VFIQGKVVNEQIDTRPLGGDTMPDTTDLPRSESLDLRNEVKPAKVGVLIVHGIGTSRANYSERFRKLLKSKLLQKYSITEPHDVCFEEVFWGALTKSGQSEADINNQIFHNQSLKKKKFRSFVLRALSDAAAYQDLDRDNRKRAFDFCETLDRTERQQMETTYDRVNDSMRRSLSNLASRVEPNSPLIVCAHSFGGQVVNCYFSDLAHDNNAKRDKLLGVVRGTAMERGETLAAIVTFGCNIPAFAFATDPAEVRPVMVPSKTLPEFAKALKAENKKAWRNYYHKGDILGFPLGTINAKYQALVEDIEVKYFNWVLDIGGAHAGYWDNKIIINDLADLICLARSKSEASPGAAASGILERIRAPLETN
jgi:hypothetical protein